MLEHPVESICGFVKGLFNWNLGTRISSGDGVSGPFWGRRHFREAGERLVEKRERTALENRLTDLHCSYSDLEHDFTELQRFADELKVKNLELNTRLKRLEYLLNRQVGVVEGGGDD